MRTSVQLPARITVWAEGPRAASPTRPEWAVRRGSMWAAGGERSIGSVIPIRRGRHPHRPPEAVGALADRSLTVGASPVSVDAASAFRDPDRDELTYAATSSAENVAAVVVEDSVVTVTPVGAGTAVVTVTVVVDYDADAVGLIERCGRWRSSTRCATTWTAMGCRRRPGRRRTRRRSRARSAGS